MQGPEQKGDRETELQSYFLKYLSEGQTDSAWNIYEPGLDHAWMKGKKQTIKQAAKKGIINLLLQEQKSVEVLKIIKSLATYYGVENSWLEDELHESAPEWDMEKINEIFPECFSEA